VGTGSPAPGHCPGQPRTGRRAKPGRHGPGRGRRAGDPQELHEAFLDALVIFEAGEKPGFLAVGPPNDRVVPVFSSEAQLARAQGPVKWFATSGADLYGLLPEGHDLILDIAGEHPLRLRRAAVGFTVTGEPPHLAAPSE